MERTQDGHFLVLEDVGNVLVVGGGGGREIKGEDLGLGASSL